MNILLQVAGFCVMIVIFIFYFNDRKAAVKQNRLFLYQSIAIFFSLFCDIFSIVLINTPSLTYSLLTYAVCRIYLVSCLVVVYFGLLYVLGDLNELGTRNLNLIRYISLSVLLIATVLILVLPLEIVFDPEGLNDFTSGIPIILTYVSTFIFMSLTLGIAFVNRKKMYHKRFKAVCIFISVWVFGSAIQGFFNYVIPQSGIVILSVSFTETLGSLAIYIMLENPSFNIDRVTGALNQRAFEDYLNTCYKRKHKVEFFIIDYDSSVTSQIMGYNKFARAVTDLLAEFNADKIFKNDRNDFIVVRHSDSPKSIIDLMVNFKEQLYVRNNIVTEIPFKIIYFNNIRYFSGPMDCINAIEYMLDNVYKYQEQIIHVTLKLATEIHRTFEMRKKCDLAFSKRNIDVYLQPIYSNNDSSFTAAEALVRLKDEDGNLIYPASFIEDMESDGRIIDLGKYVFEDVCKFISSNDMEKLGLHYIEVNLSAVQCMQDNLARTYINIMKKYKIDPKYINLEITESAQSNRETLLKNMKELTEFGVSFSLDDFGTGNSNLNYVIEMPIAVVKFDKGMVHSYFEDRIASYVMNSTIEMIKGLGHKVVFEGIELEEQIVLAKKMNVDYIQGYFYSKPINKEAFVEFLIANN